MQVFLFLSFFGFHVTLNLGAVTKKKHITKIPT